MIEATIRKILLLITSAAFLGATGSALAGDATRPDDTQSGQPDYQQSAPAQPGGSGATGDTYGSDPARPGGQGSTTDSGWPNSDQGQGDDTRGDDEDRTYPGSD